MAEENEEIINEPVTPTDDQELEGEPEGEQDPLKIELEKVKQSGRTEKEKAEFSLRKNAERLKELGGNPASILGVDNTESNDEDDAPVTLGMLKMLQSQQAKKTALELANEITNDAERELTREYLTNRIISTGNPQEDLKLARGLVNAIKNKQILEQANIKPQAKRTSSNGGSAPYVKEEEELSPEEMSFMKPPFNLTKEAIIKSRTETGKGVVEFRP